MISHACDAFAANSEIIKLSAKLHHNGPDVTTLRQLANLCELLAIRLESFSMNRQGTENVGPLSHGNYCRAIRRRYKLTIRDVADYALISRTCVTDAEIGRRSTQLASMLALSYALKTPAAKLWPALNSVPASLMEVSQCS